DADRKWEARLWINQLNCFAGEDVLWIGQFAEVTSEHFQRGNKHRICVCKDISHRFLSPVEKNLEFVGVEMVWNVVRAAHVVGKLIVVNGCSNVGQRGVGVAQPGIGVENGIARVFISRTVKLLSASLGNYANLPAR